MDDLLLKICMTLLLVVVSFLSLCSLKFFQSIILNKKQHEGIIKVEPPGTTGWPMIGETLDFVRANLKGTPEKFFFDRVQKYSSKVFKTSLLGETVTILNGTGGNKFMFSSEYKLVTICWPITAQKIVPTTAGVTSPLGLQESKDLRKKVYPSFLRRDALQKYVGVMDSLARKHFDAHWENKEEVIVYPLVKVFNFTLACRLFLSIEDDSRVNELLKLFNVVVDGIVSLPINFPGTPLNRGIKASKVIQKEFEKIVKQRMDQMHLFRGDEEKKMKKCLSSDASPSTLSPVSQPPAQDILSQMILFSDINDNPEDDEDTSVDNDTANENTLNKKKFMNETYIADLILSLIVAGYHTSSAVITVLMKYLVELPNVLHEVLNEQHEIAKSKDPGDEWLNLNDIYKMKYSWNVVSEVLRLAPPLQGGYTEALIDFAYAGYFIPKGMKLFWSGISSHMDPKNFPDPEKFDPSRFQGNGPAPYTYVPFGGGAGMCPGYEYARVQILVFLHHVVRS
ncbi:hypothetical protein MKW92_033101 [Papaver armeniacum]|nr:hypothetical protein MKW92_033101 [Papaver armeniacum]